MPGLVNGMKCSIVLDTGADFTVVSEDLVHLTDALKTFREEPSTKARVSQIDIEVLDKSLVCKAAVVPGCTQKMLLGLNIGFKNLLSLLEQKATGPVQINETRLQARRRREEEIACQEKDDKDGAVAKLDTPTVKVEPDSQSHEQSADDEGEVVPMPATPEGRDEDIPFPTLDDEQRELLVASTLSDDSLAGLKKYADECSQGHSSY